MDPKDFKNTSEYVYLSTLSSLHSKLLEMIENKELTPEQIDKLHVHINNATEVLNEDVQALGFF